MYEFVIRFSTNSILDLSPSIILSPNLWIKLNDLGMIAKYVFCEQPFMKLNCLYFLVQMNSEGFLPLSLISSFQRVQTITMNPDIIKKVIYYYFNYAIKLYSI